MPGGWYDEMHSIQILFKEYYNLSFKNIWWNFYIFYFYNNKLLINF